MIPEARHFHVHDDGAVEFWVATSEPIRVKLSSPAVMLALAAALAIKAAPALKAEQAVFGPAPTRT